MIKNLVGAGKITARADVVVIGAGTVGLVVATALARKGLSVVCLESGGWSQHQDEHPLNKVVHTKSIYSGATHGRFRCIGGTSTRWGGALIPFLPRDVEDANWPISYAEIVAYKEDVESLFGLPDGPYELHDVLNNTASHIARLAKWPRFKKRNVFNLLATEVRAEAGPRIWLNATATDFRVGAVGLERVVARTQDGSTITVDTRETILAAGAIETTRLLLLLDQQNGGSINQHDQLGRNFHDHLSVVVARLESVDRTALNRLVGFRFEKGGTMRNIRFELSEHCSAREILPCCFAHIAFEAKQKGGFDALRDLFRYLQQGRVPPIGIFLRLAAATPWLIRAAWWRLFEMRLLYADRAEIQVHMVIEQTPRPDNRISLSPDKGDLFGKPLAQIEWSVQDEDVINLRRCVDIFEETWNSSGLGKIARFVRRPEGEAEAELVLGGGICHPGGSTQMAETATSGVVDKHLRVFGLPNVRIVSTSVLPTGGGANPTMMLIMLGLRCAKELTEKLRA